MKPEPGQGEGVWLRLRTTLSAWQYVEARSVAAIEIRKTISLSKDGAPAPYTMLLLRSGQTLVTTDKAEAVMGLVAKALTFGYAPGSVIGWVEVERAGDLVATIERIQTKEFS